MELNKNKEHLTVKTVNILLFSMLQTEPQLFFANF